MAGDEDVVLNPDSTNIPVLVEDVHVDILKVNRIPQVGLDDEPAEVNLTTCQQSLGSSLVRAEPTPGSTVITEPAGSFPRTRKYLNMMSGSW
jgi:hypothetical protein